MAGRLTNLNVLLAAAFMSVGGCGTAPRGEPSPADVGAQRVPTYSEIRDRQNERTGLLQTLESAGVLEMRWIDDSGKERFEPQIDIKLLFEQPRRLALNLYKFDTVLWLGSDDERYWLFDMLTGDASVAYIGRWNAAPSSDVSLLLHPLTLLDLVGLFTMPEEAEGGAVEYDEGRGAWKVALPGRGGRIAAYFDLADLRPIGVAAIDGDGSVIAESTLDDYIRVTSVGMPPSMFPRLPRVIEIHDPDNRGTARVTLSEPTTRLEQTRLDRAVDLDRLMSALRPDEVRDLSEGGDESP